MSRLKWCWFDFVYPEPDEKMTPAVEYEMTDGTYGYIAQPTREAAEELVRALQSGRRNMKEFGI